MWNCHMSFGGVWLAWEILVWLWDCLSIESAHKLMEIRLATKGMVEFSLQLPGGDGPRCSSQACNTKASFTNYLAGLLSPQLHFLSQHCPAPFLPFLSTPLHWGSCPQHCHCTLCLYLLVQLMKGGQSVCFPAPHFPSLPRWWVGCKTNPEEN